VVKPLPLPEVIALKEAADYLKIGSSTLYRMANSGVIPGFRVGSGWRFAVETLDTWRLRQERPKLPLRKWRH